MTSGGFEKSRPPLLFFVKESDTKTGGPGREPPNQKWVTDVTEFSLFGQKLYLSSILDLHNGYLVSYIISDRPVLSMVTTMLSEAFRQFQMGQG